MRLWLETRFFVSSDGFLATSGWDGERRIAFYGVIADKVLTAIGLLPFAQLVELAMTVTLVTFTPAALWYDGLEYRHGSAVVDIDQQT